MHGHALIGTDAARLRLEETAIVREQDGIRWYRCLRCDSWLPLAPPAKPKRDLPPARDEIQLPLRGRALRDKVVLRIIAIDRAIHFLVLGVLAAAVFLFAGHEIRVRNVFYRVVNAVQGTNVSPAHPRTAASCTRSSTCSRSSRRRSTSSRRPPPRTRCWRAPKRSGCGSSCAGRNT